ncbi:hypothetical protein [Thalassiella azotivora]
MRVPSVDATSSCATAAPATVSNDRETVANAAERTLRVRDLPWRMA